MEPRTVITSRPRVRRTPLGDVVTVLILFHVRDGRTEEHITLECPLELSEPGQTWPETQK